MSDHPRLRGRARRRLLTLLQRLVDKNGVVSRAAVLREAQRTGELGISESSIEPTLNRLLRDFFQLQVIDVSDVPFARAPGLRGEIHAAASMSREAFVDQQLGDSAEEDRAFYRPMVEWSYDRFRLAASTASWKDARACRAPFHLRWIELHWRYRRR